MPHAPDSPSAPTAETGYRLEVDEDFRGERLDERLWLPCYLPHWSSRAAAAARYALRDGALHLRVEQDQPPWCPELDGELRVSSLQTGLFSGPVGSTVGQHRFSPHAVVREEQDDVRLYTPQYGFFEARVRASDDPYAMGALWMIGYEDAPERSAEICVFEIFGRDVEPEQARVGMGVHPFGDPSLVDDFRAEPLPLDVREPHTYGVEWTVDAVTFFVDDVPVRTVGQSPAYPMQFMLDVYAFPADDGGPPPGPWPKELVVETFRGYRPEGAGVSRGAAASAPRPR